MATASSQLETSLQVFAWAVPDKKAVKSNSERPIRIAFTSLTRLDLQPFRGTCPELRSIRIAWRDRFVAAFVGLCEAGKQEITANVTAIREGYVRNNAAEILVAGDMGEFHMG